MILHLNANLKMSLIFLVLARCAFSTGNYNEVVGSMVELGDFHKQVLLREIRGSEMGTSGNLFSLASMN